ncbi:MAG: zinc-ribbon domain-containing protein [Candidatus Methanomethylophilaceae archaeon]|nr:zinc-ribbon domain-containing protein [Candidatus Methanomethylophilaceae archaeon]
MRAVTYLPLFPALALALFIPRFLASSDRTSRIFFGLMILVAVLAFVYLFLLAFVPKVLTRFSHGRRCPVCYTKIDREAGFCPKCGRVTDITKSENLARCPKCGNPIDSPDREFCPRCGSMLRK